MATPSEQPESQFSRLNLPMLQAKEFGGLALPADFPNTISLPKYPVGSRCRWIPTPATDWGIVIGQTYIPSRAEAALTQWAWSYLLLLDADSPSRQWLVADWVDEADLEFFPTQPS
ncbi:hypothetical protein [Leptolyngbya sp. NIES-2104]|uniref:hypothetical protein n=1 Tax=Leptolyngbya sp. NIES-2104 TaxID=1552121 RepID=UPI001CEC16A8|nr:hypothetical protein [Leptolyngbya sp. NIES-2104]